MKTILLIALGYFIGVNFHEKVKEYATKLWNWVFHKVTGL